jgi:hypothetical protein
MEYVFSVEVVTNIFIETTIKAACCGLLLDGLRL